MSKYQFHIKRVALIVAASLALACQSHLAIKTKPRSKKPNVVTESDTLEKSPKKRPKPVIRKYSKDELIAYCLQQLSELPGQKPDAENLRVVCNQVEVLQGCYSKNGAPIIHYDRLARDKSKEKRVMALALIHGDEGASGTVARSWMQRLERLDPRNKWRVIPISNPDGLKIRSRVNSAGVDLNRNFPTRDWEKAALKRWREEKKSDPRKYPGAKPASEIETQCLISHFKEFRPNFIISIHTPYGVLDFDGPRMKFPLFKPLPWISLGNYPGSLGRYMWVDQKTPVLTIELKGEQGVNQLEKFDRLQDISGTVAIQSTRLIKLQDRNNPASKK